MKIKWYRDFCGGIFLYEEDLAHYPNGSKSSIKEHLQNNSFSFTKEELLFLNELIESEDNANLIIAFTIIDKK